MDMRLGEAEVECVKKLAVYYSQGNLLWERSSVDADEWAEVACTVDNFETILGTMEYIGAIANVIHASSARYLSFTIEAKVLQISRVVEAEEAKKNEREDIVDMVKNSVRKNPVGAWVLVGFFVFVALLTAVSQTISILKNLGLI